MVAPTNNNDPLLFLLIGAALSPGGDPYARDRLYRFIRERRRDFFRGSSADLEEVLEYLVHRPWPPERYLEEMREEMRHFERHMSSSIDKQSSFVTRRLETVSENFNGGLARLESELQKAKNDVHELTWLLSIGSDIASVRLQRNVPVRIYFSDPVPDVEKREVVVKALESLAKDVGLIRSYELPDESGSWWKRFWLKTEEFLTQDEVQLKIGKVQKAAEVRYLDKPQAEANHLQAQAAACLIDSLKDVQKGCIQVGSLLLLKMPDDQGVPVIVSRTLSAEELVHLESNHIALKSPERVLEWLSSSRKRIDSDIPQN